MLISRMFLCTVPKKEPEEQRQQKEEQQHNQQSKSPAGDSESNKEHLEAVRRYCSIYTL
jgi:hypothetical protein